MFPLSNLQGVRFLLGKADKLDESNNQGDCGLVKSRVYIKMKCLSELFPTSSPKTGDQIPICKLEDRGILASATYSKGLENFKSIAVYLTSFVVELTKQYELLSLEKMYQRWQDLIFYHWEYPAAVIQSTLPPGLVVDAFGERAFLSIVAFSMRGLRPRGLPSVPVISNFLELNLRTYVKDEMGRPGVWFYSLDADSWISVEMAQRFFHLPYMHARLEKQMGNDLLRYVSRAKRDPNSVGVEYVVKGHVSGNLDTAPAESIESFWVERYRLFAFDELKQQLSSGTISHDPYRISAVEAITTDTRLMELNGFELPETKLEKAYYSPGVAVTVTGFERI